VRAGERAPRITLFGFEVHVAIEEGQVVHVPVRVVRHHELRPGDAYADIRLRKLKELAHVDVLSEGEVHRDIFMLKCHRVVVRGSSWIMIHANIERR
jgi:hypothetical protein